MALKAYHISWLSAHSERSEEWLQRMISDGFDVHHLDGNHSNDDPKNLVLIEHVDHMRLHKAPGNRLLASKTFGSYGGRRSGLSSETMIQGQQAYYGRKSGKPWRDLGGHKALVRAKKYAASTRSDWPIRSGH